MDLLLSKNNGNGPKLEIYATRRYHLSRRDKIEHFEDKIEWIDCDLTDPVSTTKMIKNLRPDHVYHMAAESFVSPSWDHPHRYMDVNYSATVNLLEAIKDYSKNTKILIPGSGEEYGEIFESELPINLSSPLRPVNPYAVTKIAQDLISFVYFKSYGLNVVRLRTFNHEGPRRERYFGIASYCYQIARIEEGLQESIIQVGDIADKRNFTHVKDIVRAYYLAMEHCKPGELYLVGSENESSIATFAEVLDKLKKLSTVGNIKIEKVEKFIRPTAVPYLIAETSKFRDLTNWKPDFDLDFILSDVLNYWRTRIKNHPAI